MPENQISQQAPQFGPLETSTPGGAICKVCQTPLARTYYRAENNMVCGRCADRIRREMPQDSHAAFVRAILCGLAGFAVGLVIYATFAIATGITIGYLALAVGFIVGKAMMIGSRGVGGRRFQIRCRAADVCRRFYGFRTHRYPLHGEPAAPAVDCAVASDAERQFVADARQLCRRSFAGEWLKCETSLHRRK
jgi:hypothetical protein